MKTNSRIKPIGDEGVLPSVSSCFALQEEEEVFMNISGGNITYGDLHVPFFWRVSNRTELNHHLVDVREGRRGRGEEERRRRKLFSVLFFCSSGGEELQ